MPMWLAVASFGVLLAGHLVLVVRFATRVEVTLAEAIRRITALETKVDTGKVVILRTKRRDLAPDEDDEA